MSPSLSVSQILGPEHRPTNEVRCPVHGFIAYSNAEKAVIDSPPFQRLRSIRQLAYTHYVYPGAMHSRFEHSLGVMELATRAFDAVSSVEGTPLLDELGEVGGLETDTVARARQLVRLLGLLHDVGHTPFSHAGEVIAGEQRHEHVSAWAVSRDGPLGDMLDERFFPGVAGLLQTMLLEKDVPPQLLCLKQIVSGQLDVDRIDYLLRDSHHCGVEYGKFDYLRLLGSLVAHRNANTQSLAIGIRPGGVHAFEGLLLARYFMNTQVYMHRTRRAYDVLLRNWLDFAVPGGYADAAAVLQEDDVTMQSRMILDARGSDAEPGSVWARRLIGRDHPKLLLEFGDHADHRDKRRMNEISAVLQQEFPSVVLVPDLDASGKVHSLWVPGEQDAADDLFVIESSARASVRAISIAERSAVIEKVPKLFWVIRLFAYARDDAQAENLRARAEELARG